MMRSKNAQDPLKTLTTRNRILRAVIAVVVLISSIVVSIYVYERQHAAHEVSKMKTYLESKYNQRFVVEDYRIQGAGIAVKGGGVADAHREGSSYKFLVLEQGPSYRDNYLSAVYNEQEEQSVVDVVKKLELGSSRYTADIHIDVEVADNIKGVPTLADTLGKYSDNVTYGVSIIKTGAEPEENDLNNLKLLAEYVKSKNPKRYAVRYVINSNKSNSRYVCQYYGWLEKKVTIHQDLSKACFKRHEGKE